MTIFLTIISTLGIFFFFLMLTGLILKVNDLEKEVNKIKSGEFQWSVKATPDNIKKTLVYETSKKRMN